jgi:hypothetical protein
MAGGDACWEDAWLDAKPSREAPPKPVKSSLRFKFILPNKQNGDKSEQKGSTQDEMSSRIVSHPSL